MIKMHHFAIYSECMCRVRVEHAVYYFYPISYSGRILIVTSSHFFCYSISVYYVNTIANIIIHSIPKCSVEHAHV